MNYDIYKFKKYKENLCLINIDGKEYVKSYETLVAVIEDDYLKQLGYWSQTTQKHISYAAKELKLTIKK